MPTVDTIANDVEFVASVPGVVVGSTPYVPPPAPAEGSLASLQTREGKYFTAQVGASGITVTRYEHPTPNPQGAAFSGLATSGGPGDRGPHLLRARKRLDRPAQLLLHFERAGQMLLVRSDDEGQ